MTRKKSAKRATRKAGAVNVRPATALDLQFILEMRRRSYAAGKLERLVGPFEADHFRIIFERAIAAPGLAWLLVAELNGRPVGASFGILVEVWLAPNKTCAAETFIWVEPEARGAGVGSAIVATIEQWARDRRASFVSMFSFPTLTPEGMRRLCKSRGYFEAETNHIRRIA